MASRDTEFAAFVDARGPALIRTASLLELDDSAAQDAVVVALGQAARQWRVLSRDGNAEAEARRHIHQALVDRWRRHDAGNTVPPETALGDDSSSARQALAALTNRQRALVVLSGFDGLTSTEVARPAWAPRPATSSGTSTKRPRGFAAQPVSRRTPPSLPCSTLRPPARFRPTSLTGPSRRPARATGASLPARPSGWSRSLRWSTGVVCCCSPDGADA